VVTVPGTGQVPIGQVRFGARRGMGNRMVAKAHEVPLPPPEQPERRRRRDPAFERPSIAVDGASVWVADVRRSARELARRENGAPVALTIELDDGTRVNARVLVAGPGEAFVTVSLADRELALRLDRIPPHELTRAPAGGARH